ncbi:MAG: 50S ribosomal protein L31 [Candidatus Omnitrophica bacterium]|nr:50S ribosomal protein L31 [Candidatus Omnitrophota bacterium]
MRKNIHPEYKETIITCACGEVIHTRSTKQNIKVDICSKCHPFFTGKQKLVDSAGMVDRFKKRYADTRPRKDAGKKTQVESGQEDNGLSQETEQGSADQVNDDKKGSDKV